MTCAESNRLLHEYLDDRLSAPADAALEAHLSDCHSCRLARDDFLLMRRSLSLRHALPQAVRSRMLRRLQRRRQRSLSGLIREGVDRIYTYCRDLERPVLWSKLGAVPVTAVFFFGLLLQFSPASERLTLPVFHAVNAQSDHLLVHSVNLRPTRSQMNALVETAWRTPYEDSMSFVGEITPDSRIRIDDVMEYPKNLELLKAWDLALQGARIDPLEEKARTVFVYHKIDVFEGL